MPNKITWQAHYTLRLKNSGKVQRKDKIQETTIKPKQSQLCITGRKYLGGTDQKRKTVRERKGPSSKKPSTSQPSKQTNNQYQNFICYYHIT